MSRGWDAFNQNLDLWKTAKPILNKFREQMGVKGFVRNLKEELPYWSYIMPTLPRNFATTLTKLQDSNNLTENYTQLTKDYRRMNYILMLIIVVLIIVLAVKL